MLHRRFQPRGQVLRVEPARDVGLGAGRAKKEDAVDPTAGFVLLKKPGQAVAPGEALAHVFAADPSRVDAEAVRNAFSFNETPPQTSSLLIDRYDGERWASAAR